MVNAIFVLIVFLLTLNKDKIYLVWPWGVKENITFDSDTQEVGPAILIFYSRAFSIKIKIAAGLKELRDRSVFFFAIFNALFVLIVFMLTLNKDVLYISWPWGVKENITFTEDGRVRRPLHGSTRHGTQTLVYAAHA